MNLIAKPLSDDMDQNIQAVNRNTEILENDELTQCSRLDLLTSELSKLRQG
jgi:hypothetical protein